MVGMVHPRLWVSHENTKSLMIGCRYLHTAIDDRTRIVYSEIHIDEKTTTAAGFWTRTAEWS